MGMELRALSKNYAVRALDSKDLAAIYALSCKNELYYQYHPPFVTRESIIEDMKALPPGKTYEDKYYIGFFEGDVLVAMMDLILGYPTDKIAFIWPVYDQCAVPKQGRWLPGDPRGLRRVKTIGLSEGTPWGR